VRGGGEQQQQQQQQDDEVVESGDGVADTAPSFSSSCKDTGEFVTYREAVGMMNMLSQ
jgi:hypothetical protein